VARDVTELVSVDERQARQERLAVLGEVAAVVAHELNNPLSAVAMYAQMMQDELAPGSPFREHVDVIRRNTETCSRTIRGLLDWAYSADPEVTSTDVNELVEESLRFVRPLTHRAPVVVAERQGLADAEVHVDAVQLRQVLVNLLMNAVQALTGRGGRIEITTAEADDGRTVVLDVTDDGPGVPPDRRDRIFEPFFTTKPAGEGTGLGLPISRRIVEAHGGTLELVASGAGRTTFRVRLPRRARVVARRPAPASAAGGPS
jgi:signal transduction histidine kinase